MPNIKSAEKRVRIEEKKTLRNNMIKSEFRTACRKFEAALENDEKEAKELLAEAKKLIDSACAKGVIKKNTAARKKSRLDRKMNKAVAEKKKAKAE